MSLSSSMVAETATGEDLVPIRIWGSPSQRQSQVPRVLYQTCCGLSSLQFRDCDRARSRRGHFITPGWPPGHPDLFRLPPRRGLDAESACVFRSGANPLSPSVIVCSEAATQVASCAREVKSSLVRMCSTWLSAARCEITAAPTTALRLPVQLIAPLDRRPQLVDHVASFSSQRSG